MQSTETVLGVQVAGELRASKDARVVQRRGARKRTFPVRKGTSPCTLREQASDIYLSEVVHHVERRRGHAARGI
jgi:hypothetical protein